ncbi:hypothetical protein E3Q13_03511 [Wallemia mellicola]|nr:hypothetical protein E3Q13_03511 [Wallemia mellicola]
MKWFIGSQNVEKMLAFEHIKLQAEDLIHVTDSETSIMISHILSRNMRRYLELPGRTTNVPNHRA